MWRRRGVQHFYQGSKAPLWGRHWLNLVPTGKNNRYYTAVLISRYQAALWSLCGTFVQEVDGSNYTQQTTTYLTRAHSYVPEICSGVDFWKTKECLPQTLWSVFLYLPVTPHCSSSLPSSFFILFPMCSILQMYEKCVCAHKQLEFKASLHATQHTCNLRAFLFLCNFFLLPQTYRSLFASHLSVCFLFLSSFPLCFSFIASHLLSSLCCWFLSSAFFISLSLTFPV